MQGVGATMWWLSMSIIVCHWVIVTTAAVTVADLTCNHPHCVKSGHYVDTTIQPFIVQNHEIIFEFVDGHTFHILCDAWQALDSPALPSFTCRRSVMSVKLSACSLPSTRSLVEALAAINVTQQTSGETTLKLFELPTEPQLTAAYFSGFENITNLTISSIYPPKPNPDFSFLMKLQNLRSLIVAGVQVPDDVVFPTTLTSLTLISMTVRPLSVMLREASIVRYLKLEMNKIVPADFGSNVTDTQRTKLSAVEEVVINEWAEKRPAPLENCDGLLRLQLSLPITEELPNRWVAACPRLETIFIYGSYYLYSVPPKLLEGATALKNLTITVGLLESLPDGFLEGAPNLINLDVTSHYFKILPSAVFVGPALQSLTLAFNDLENLGGIGSLTSLTNLNLDNNRFGNLCDQNGDSGLKNLVQLKELNLRRLNITHICRDWREDMKFLTHLYLEATEITELGLADLIYSRDTSVKNVSLFLSYTPLTRIRLTEDDYRKAIAIPIETTVVLATHPKLTCDCDVYWTWKALVTVNNTNWMNIRCSDSSPLQVKLVSEVCPERSGE